MKDIVEQARKLLISEDRPNDADWLDLTEQLADEIDRLRKQPTILLEAHVSLRKQLDWRGPNGKTQGLLTLTRAEAEAILASSTDSQEGLEYPPRQPQKWEDLGGHGEGPLG